MHELLARLVSGDRATAGGGAHAARRVVRHRSAGVTDTGAFRRDAVSSFHVVNRPHNPKVGEL